MGQIVWELGLKKLVDVSYVCLMYFRSLYPFVHKLRETYVLLELELAVRSAT